MSYRLPTVPAENLPAIHVVEEVNHLMQKQRIQQSNTYKEMLNAKATKKKKMIRSLMNLWQAAKVSFEDRQGVSKFQGGSADVELKRLQAMPRDDIITQTGAIQQLLVDDMQEQTGTKRIQLVDRINLLRQGISNGTIADVDTNLANNLQEINILENALLQANNDGMRLAARIIKQLTAKRAVGTY